jgi:hypothetical protein
MRHRTGTEPVNSFADRRYGADRTTREEVVLRPVLLRLLANPISMLHRFHAVWR